MKFTLPFISLIAVSLSAATFGTSLAAAAAADTVVLSSPTDVAHAHGSNGAHAHAHAHGSHGGIGNGLARRMNKHKKRHAAHVAKAVIPGAPGSIKVRRLRPRSLIARGPEDANANATAPATTTVGKRVCKIRATGASLSSGASTTVAATNSVTANNWAAAASSSSAAAPARSSSSSAVWSSSATPTSSSVWVAPPTPTTSSSVWVAPPSTTAAPSPSAAPPSYGGAIWGVTNAWGQQCGCSDDAPNGNNAWLMTGVDSGGWNPPFVTGSMLQTLPIDSMFSNEHFQACGQYKWIFEQIAAESGIPAQLLIAIAAQESGCNAGAHNPNSGEGGTVGLMQLKVKYHCPGGTDCYDPYTNIRIAANVLNTFTSQYGGNILAGLGVYNGWTVGMTTAQFDPWAGATPTYLNQVLNGWLQGRYGYNLN